KHDLIIEAFSQLIHPPEGNVSHSIPPEQNPHFGAKLVLIGSVRNSDDATKVYDLRLLANEKKVKDKVEFVCDSSWKEILQWLRKSSIGVNAMWNEHFGIGVVEYQAAELISVVHNSGGPKMDIVVRVAGGKTDIFHSFSC
ncbi:asparagine-linked glycosylation protein, partial [Rhizina undulata]